MKNIPAIFKCIVTKLNIQINLKDKKLVRIISLIKEKKYFEFQIKFHLHLLLYFWSHNAIDKWITFYFHENKWSI